MSFTQLQTEVLENIQEALSSLAIAGTADADEFQDDIDFWLDEDIVLYNSSLGDDEIQAASYEDLDVEDPYLSLFLTQQIKQTYLSTGDLALVVGVHEDDDTFQVCIAGLDRSTGVALIDTVDLFDRDVLAESGRIASQNTKDPSNRNPILRKYQLVTGADNAVSDSKKDNSQRRLTSLLSEIDQHVLSRFLGREVKVDETQ